jgi:transcription initiation factor TFIIIB Brf1 subunit/transcription initiation factor TFIIB
MWGGKSVCFVQSLARGRTEIEDVAEKLGVRPREDLCNAAARLYKLAVQRNFTRGRRVQQVRVAEVPCLTRTVIPVPACTQAASCLSTGPGSPSELAAIV